MGFTAGQMANAALGLQAFGATSNAIGGYFQAGASKANLNSQAAMADSNARLAELGAQSALSQGAQQSASLTLKAGQLKSRQRASLAANGVDLGVGSAAEIQASTELMKEVDKNQLELNALRNAWGYRAQGVNYQNEALAKRAQAASTSPAMALAGGLLSGATSVASSWYMFSKDGALAQAAPAADVIGSGLTYPGGGLGLRWS